MSDITVTNRNDWVIDVDAVANYLEVDKSAITEVEFTGFRIIVWFRQPAFDNPRNTEVVDISIKMDDYDARLNFDVNRKPVRHFHF